MWHSPSALRRLTLLAGGLAVLSLGWGSYRALTSSNDLLVRFEEWEWVVAHGWAMPGWRVPYHPVTYVLLTPLVLLPPLAAKIILWLLNLAGLVYVWRRCSQLTALAAERRWLFLALFGAWACVRVTIGSGQLSLLCLGCLLWAFPWQTTGAGARLALGLMKHTLIYPVVLRALWKSPRAVWVTLLAALLPFGVLMACSELNARAFLEQSLQATGKMLSGWEGGTSVVTALRLFFPGAAWIYPVVIVAWLALFVFLVHRVRDPLVQLAALLLMGLWPFYHRPYDLALAAPTLALFLKHGRVAWAVGLTVVLLGLFEKLDQQHFFHAAAVRQVFSVYYPLTIFACLAALWRLDRATIPAPPTR